MDTMCWFCVERHMSVNLDAFVKKEAIIFFIHLSWLFMDGDWKWFWSPEKWRPKKPSLPDCNNWESRLRWSKIFGHCKILFFLMTKYFGCLIRVIKSTLDQLPPLIWWPNFWVAIFCNWIFLSPFFFLEKK